MKRKDYVTWCDAGDSLITTHTLRRWLRKAKLNHRIGIVVNNLENDIIRVLERKGEK